MLPGGSPGWWRGLRLLARVEDGCVSQEVRSIQSEHLVRGSEGGVVGALTGGAGWDMLEEYE